MEGLEKSDGAPRIESFLAKLKPFQPEEFLLD